MTDSVVRVMARDGNGNRRHANAGAAMASGRPNVDRFGIGAVGDSSRGELYDVVLKLDELIEERFAAGFDARQAIERRAADLTGPDLAVDAYLEVHGLAITAETEPAMQKSAHDCLRDVPRIEKRTALPKILARSNSMSDIAATLKVLVDHDAHEKKPT
ncbi:hypothetical protein [Pandoraea capi]|uniref:hypothetical protein n=1 Tax=Pandoraea capi TaxID=2508286 RepID=UPI001FE59994|nr:hypothetical protein [Pandoraea capi]